MNTRHHQGWGHGLRPGTTADINCGACTAEDKAGQVPIIEPHGPGEPVFTTPAARQAWLDANSEHYAQGAEHQAWCAGPGTHQPTAREMRARAARELAAEFGDDESEWTV